MHKRYNIPDEYMLAEKKTKLKTTKLNRKGGIMLSLSFLAMVHPGEARSFVMPTPHSLYNAGDGDDGMLFNRMIHQTTHTCVHVYGYFILMRKKEEAKRQNYLFFEDTTLAQVNLCTPGLRSTINRFYSTTVAGVSRWHVFDISAVVLCFFSVFFLVALNGSV